MKLARVINQNFVRDGHRNSGPNDLPEVYPFTLIGISILLSIATSVEFSTEGKLAIDHGYVEISEV